MSSISNNSILCVGLNCLDIVSECDTFPREDDKVGSTTIHNRCISQRWQRGGNASNNCTVLGILGVKPTLACTLANSPEKQFMVSDMEQYGISTDGIVSHDRCHCPSSVVLCSMATGSRTIVHSNQDLPELSLQDFNRMQLNKYHWIHFEGRNVEAVAAMQRAARATGAPVTVSVELEKPRPDMELLWQETDVIFASKDYAKHLGFEDMQSAVEGIAKKAANRCSFVIIAWGEAGACGRSRDGTVVCSPAFPPAGGVVDTLGAGDTFIAATIYALSRRASLQASITYGCKVAGLKVGLKGWAALRAQLPSAEWRLDV